MRISRRAAIAAIVVPFALWTIWFLYLALGVGGISCPDGWAGSDPCGIKDVDSVSDWASRHAVAILLAGALTALWTFAFAVIAIDSHHQPRGER